MDYFENSEQMKNALWVKKVILSCNNENQVDTCSNLVDNFRRKFGDDWICDELNFALLHKKKILELKSRLKTKPKKYNTTMLSRTRVRFLKDPMTFKIFAHFMDYETQWPRLMKLCFYEGMVCELSYEYLERCTDAFFHEYRDLLKVIINNYPNVEVLTPQISLN